MTTNDGLAGPGPNTRPALTFPHRYAPQEHRHAQSVRLVAEWGRSGRRSTGHPVRAPGTRRGSGGHHGVTIAHKFDILRLIGLADHRDAPLALVSPCAG